MLTGQFKQIRDRITRFCRVKASDLLPNPKNWRIHPVAQRAALQGLLAEVGYADALLARQTPDGGLVLIDGHLRAELTPEMEVPVLVLDVTEAEADKILLTLDPLAGMAEMDSDRIRQLLATVNSDDVAVRALLTQLGRDAGLDPGASIEEPPAPLDRAGELAAKWGTQRGQLWQLGACRLLCADCRDGAAVGRLWCDGGVFRMVWTDPPYGVRYADKNKYLKRSDRGNRIQTPIAGDHLTPAQAQALFTGGLAAAQAFGIAGAACYATVPGGPLLARFIVGFEDGGFRFRHLLVWVKQHFVIGMGDYQNRHEPVLYGARPDAEAYFAAHDEYQERHEPILYGWRHDAAHYFADDRTQDSVFEVDRPAVSEFHPTTKPVALIARMLLNSSRAGEIIYDPFCGSGSTLLAAQQLDRLGYGVEIDPGYAAVTLERFTALGIIPEKIDGP